MHNHPAPPSHRDPSLAINTAGLLTGLNRQAIRLVFAPGIKGPSRHIILACRDAAPWMVRARPVPRIWIIGTQAHALCSSTHRFLSSGISYCQEAKEYNDPNYLSHFDTPEITEPIPIANCSLPYGFTTRCRIQRHFHRESVWPKPRTCPALPVRVGLSKTRASFKHDLAVGATGPKRLPPSGPLALRRNVILASIWAGRNCSAGIAERLHHLAILRTACGAVGDRELARFLLCSAREGPAQCLIVSPGPRPPSIRWSPPGITSPMPRQKNAVVLGGTSFLRKRQHWQQQGCGDQNSIRRSHTSLVDVMPAF
ncbi:hypothetical protein D3C73_732560 [compost metagenome]